MVTASGVTAGDLRGVRSWADAPYQLKVQGMALSRGASRTAGGPWTRLRTRAWSFTTA